MTELEKKYNFYSDGVFYIHGTIDESILIDIIPELRKKIYELVGSAKDIQVNDKITDTEKAKQLAEIKIVFNIASPGGTVNILFQMLNLIEYAKVNNITIETHAHAVSSCASVLEICGSKGFRYGGQLSCHYIHNARGALCIRNNIENKRAYENRERLLNTVKDIYKNNTKLTKEIIDNNINDEHWVITGDDLKEYGLIDKFYHEIDKEYHKTTL
jgi:ATP-dependent protease ClpP protease subunit